MYGRSRKILIVNFSLFLLEAAISGIIVASYFRKMTCTSASLLTRVLVSQLSHIRSPCSRRHCPGVNARLVLLHCSAKDCCRLGCTCVASDIFLSYTNFITALAYEIWLACLALYKLKQEHEVMKALPGTSLITLIVRDNIIYFFM